MTTVSLKLPDPLALRLDQTAKRRSTSKSAVIRDALEVYLSGIETLPQGSALSLACDVQGMLSGPEDLSTNKNYLQNFGR